MGVCIVAVGLQPSAQSRRRAQSAFAQGSSAPGRTRPTPLQVNVFSLSCGATPAAQQLSFRAQRRGRRARSTTLPRNALADSDKVSRNVIFADGFTRQYAHPRSVPCQVAIAVPDVSAEAAKRLRRLEVSAALNHLYVLDNVSVNSPSFPACVFFPLTAPRAARASVPEVRLCGETAVGQEPVRKEVSDNIRSSPLPLGVEIACPQNTHCGRREEKDQSGKAPPQVEEEDENDPKNLLDRHVSAVVGPWAVPCDKSLPSP